MAQSMLVLLLTALVFFNGFGSIHSEMEVIDGGGTEESSDDSGPSKCDRSRQEECCTVAVVGDNAFTVYTEMSTRGRHTVVNMTSAGLQEYTMYFAVRGKNVDLQLSPTSPANWNHVHYRIAFSDNSGGNIFMVEFLSSITWIILYDESGKNNLSTNAISAEQYSYYYVKISGDTLELGRRGGLPLVNHTSTELRKLKYFSFRWMDSQKGEALYDCTAE